MAASINDKISKVSTGPGRPAAAIVQAARPLGGTTITCDDLTNWTTTEAQHCARYQLDTSGKIIPGTQVDLKAIVSGNTLTNVIVTGGTDSAFAVGDVIIALPTAQYANDLATALLVSHNQDGTLKANSVTTAAIADNAVTTGKIDWPTYTNWSTSAVVTGWSSTTVKEFHYQRIGNIVFFYARVEGASNSTTATMSLPIPVAVLNTTTAMVLNNGNWSSGAAVIESSTVTLLTETLASLSATGTKGFRVNGFYFV